MDRIQWHKDRGDKIVVVSASLDVYHTHWCSEHDVELICTQIEYREEICTGEYLGADCTGPEKAKRVNEIYDLSQFDDVNCYGDTSEDSELLELGTKKYFRWKLVK